MSIVSAGFTFSRDLGQDEIQERLRKIFNPGGTRATVSEESRPNACARCSLGSRGSCRDCKEAAHLA